MAFYKEDIVNIDLESGSIHRSFLNHSIGRGDDSANRFGIRVFRSGQAEDLNGAQCQGFFRNSRGENIALTSYGTVSGNVAYVTLPQACYNYEGQFTLAIKLVGSDVTGTMRIVDGIVDNTNTDGAVAPTDSVPTYQEILAVYGEMVETLEDYDDTVAEQDAKIEAEDAKIDEIKETLGKQIPNDYFNVFNWEEGKSLDVDGTEIVIADWWVSEYIEVPENSTGLYTLNYIIMGGVHYKMRNQWVAEYDANKTFIRMNVAVDSSSVPEGFEYCELTDGCKYIRTTTHENMLDEEHIYFNDKNIIKASYNAFSVSGRHDYVGVIQNDGTVLSHASFGYTDFIEVPKWANRMTTYNVVTLGDGDHPLSNYQFATYDENKDFIENVHGNTYIGYVTTPIDPETVRFVRIDYGVANISDCVCIFSNAADDPQEIWHGKTGDFLGDSLTEQNQYTSRLAGLYGITVNNYGKSGTTISNINSTNYFVTRVSGMSQACDFVFVMGGTNDWGLSAALGSKTDTTADTFYGGLYLLFEALRSRFPAKPIFVSTITQRNWQGSGQASGIDSNNNNNSLMEFNEAIEYMAHRYGCIVLDGFGECGICVSNLSTYTSDNLHFNATGGERFAKFVMDAMNQHVPY